MFVDLVDFCGQDEIAFRKSVDFVRPGRDPDFSPGEEDVRVVPLFLCKLAYAVHKLERPAEIGELEGLRDVVFFDDVPAVHLRSRAASSWPLRGGTPPRHGTHVLVASPGI